MINELANISNNLGIVQNQVFSNKQFLEAVKKQQKVLNRPKLRQNDGNKAPGLFEQDFKAQKKYRIESTDEHKFTNLRNNVKRHGVSVVLCSEQNEGELRRLQRQK